MIITLPQAEKILKSDQVFSLFAFSMMMTLLRKRYANDQSQAMLQNCTNEINLFIAKYRSIMSSDLEKITQINQ